MYCMKHYFLTAVMVMGVVTLAGCQKSETPLSTTSDYYNYGQEEIIINQQQPMTDQTVAPDTNEPTVLPATVTAIMKTNKGSITLSLDAKAAPATVENFVTLAKSGFYDGTKFHRVIKDFMIQGGDPLSKDESKKAYWGTGGPDYRFADEINSRKLVRGSLAMANAGPDTNGSQFFIVTLDATPWLDGKHTNFGQVTDGMDVVDAIENSPVGAGDKPLENIVVESITIK